MKPTTDEVLAWADQVGMAYLKHIEQNSMQQVLEYTALAYTAGAKAMQERCADACEVLQWRWLDEPTPKRPAYECAEAIRALGGNDD